MENSIPIMFASIDMMNSTKIKSRHPNWPRLVAGFYAVAVAAMEEEYKKALNIPANTAIHALQNRKSYIDRPILWKYIGDEVLFYSLAHGGVEKVYRKLQIFYQVLSKVSSRLREIAPGLLDAKGTCWLALVRPLGVTYASTMDGAVEKFDQIDMTREEFDSFTLNKRISPNYFYYRQKNDNSSKLYDVLSLPDLDFIGPDIDCGFRLGASAHRRKLVVSADLARLVIRSDCIGGSERKKFQYVFDKKLKGVWDDRPYPIIYYQDDWDSILESIDYDDPSEFSTQIKLNIDPKTGAISLPLTDKRLNKVFLDIGRDSIFSEIDRCVSGDLSTLILGQ